jgi:hypothetical protein
MTVCKDCNTCAMSIGSPAPSPHMQGLLKSSSRKTNRLRLVPRKRNDQMTTGPTSSLYMKVWPGNRQEMRMIQIVPVVYLV